MTIEPVLGRLSTVQPRDVWRNEASNFTPWLLQNADVLCDLLGMDLALEEAEHAAGDFSLDLIGLDETTGQRVIVENQLEESDHKHLGQILTYAAGTDPTTIVWVATSFRSEHRAALDWLNERTDENTRFFGVVIEVVRIGDSAPAPAFKLVAQPNDWGKHVRATAQQTGLTEREQSYQGFWSKFSARVRGEHPTWTRGTTTKSSWFTMSAGIPNVNWISTFTQKSLGLQLEFVSSDQDLNLTRFYALEAHRTELEAAFGEPLTWEPREGYKGTRVAFYGEPADVQNVEEWDSCIDWLINTGERLRAAIDSIGGVQVIIE
ncbi:DUF4268 domain-containing protein [Gryllotalpicola reticulitermitis]|uniref:DUF4268 domain-containing protein n=1 Tax=Gryllotalpicola reticulitermitis TaxID=1184153 RepID=A0ABV8QD10_9MICO